jgi:tetratricopeptide (TPR) repeat protein
MPLRFLTLAASDTSAAYRAGQIIGGAAILLLVGFGIYRMIVALGRRDTSKLCAISLLCIFTGWFISAIISLLQRFVPEMPPILLGLVGLVCMLFVIAAPILGIVGLCLFNRRRHRRGKGYAIWAIVLGVAMWIFLGFVMVSAFKKGVEGRPSLATASHQPGETLEKPDLNFAITPPDGWRPLAGQLNPSASVSLRRLSPEIFCVVIAEKLGQGADPAAMKTLVLSNLSNAGTLLEQKEDEVTIQGITFTRVRSTLELYSAGMKFHYENWFALHNGYSWQVALWSLAKNDPKVLADEAAAVMKGFRILDPDKKVASAGTAVDVAKAEKGFRARIAGKGWNAISAESAAVDFGVRRVYEAIEVTSLRFDEEPPDLEALTRGFVSQYGLPDPADGGFESKPWTPGGELEGIEFSIERKISGEDYRYIFRVGRGPKQALLVAGWADVKSGDFELLRNGMDSVEMVAATGPAPELSAKAAKETGLIYNESAISLQNRGKIGEASELFMRGFEIGNDPTLLGNAANCWEKAEKYEEGISRLAPLVGKFPKDEYANIQFARLQVLNGDPAAGNTTFLAMVNSETEESQLLKWMNFLVDQSQTTEAIRAADAWIAKKPGIKPKRWRAETLFVEGKTEEAIKELNTLWTENPKDAGLGISLASHANEAEDYPLATKVAEALIAEGNKTRETYLILGWSKMGQHSYADAKAAFLEAGRFRDKDAEVEEALRLASSMLGEGNNSKIRTPVEPVPIPKALATAFEPGEVPVDFAKDHPAVWLKRVKGIAFEKGKPLRETVRNVVRVQTTEGAKLFGTIRKEFDPVSERVFVNRLEVRDPQGKVVSTGTPNASYVRDLDDGMASHRQVLHVPVAGLKVGYTIDWEISVESLVKSEEFDFQDHVFASSLPVVLDALYVTGRLPDLKDSLTEAGSVEVLRDKNAVAWISRNQAPVREEPYGLSLSRVYPNLGIAEAGNWKKVGANYHAELKEQLRPDPEVDKVAKDLVEGATTLQDKVERIVRYLRDEFTYKAIEFGVRARRPNGAAKTMELRYGDCKDLSVLLHQMLRAVDIPSQLTLVNTGKTILPDLPSLDQFDHMVVTVPSLGEGWLVDATAKELNPARFPADGFWKNNALVLDSEASRLVATPEYAGLGSCDVICKRTATQDGRDWKIQETVELGGYMGSWTRAGFSGMNSDEQFQRAQAILSRAGSARLDSFEFQNLDDPFAPAILKLSYTVRDAISKDGKGISLPGLWEVGYLETSFVGDRKTPFAFYYPLKMTTELTMKLSKPVPAGLIENLAQGSKSEFADWSLRAKPDSGNPGELSVRFDFNGAAGEWEAAKYGAAHDTWDAARNVWNRPLE